MQRILKDIAMIIITMKLLHEIITMTVYTVQFL